MKRIIFILLLFFISFNVYASEKIEVKFSKCVDGDTAWFKYRDSEYKFRFLGINTPEIENTKDYLVLDVRTQYEFDKTHVDNSIHITIFTQS